MAKTPSKSPVSRSAGRPKASRKWTWGSIGFKFFTMLLIATPFFVGGVWGLVDPEFPAWAALAIIGTGGLALVTGAYLSFVVKFPAPALIAGEDVLASRNPTMKPAFARILMSIPFFLVSGYLLMYTVTPYVYAFVPFMIGLVVFSRGAYRYWVNHCTTYYVTDRRIIHMYQFGWLHTTEIPVARIISISESRSFFEVLTGRGSILVASGIGSGQKIRMEDIDSPGPVADAIRGLIP